MKTVRRDFIMCESKSRLYNILDKMKQRCYNPRHKSYKSYGAKGITICDEWRTDYYSFKQWAVINGYDIATNTLTLDRIDNSRGYAPSNCRWIPKAQQTKHTTLTIHLTVRGKEYTCISDVAVEYGLNGDTVRDRYRRGDREEQLIRPSRTKSKKS